MGIFGHRYKDGDLIEVEGVRVRLKANRRARRVSLRVDAARAEVVATAPSERGLTEAVAFAKSRAGWMVQRLASRPAGVGFAPGRAIPFRGSTLRLEAVPTSAAARLKDGLIVSGGEGEAYARRIERLLRTEAKRELSARTEHHARALGLKVPKVSLGDPKSRWGSCTPTRGTIRYSWRLILAPDWVLDYVAAHEVAHLVHADHSPHFWAVVKGLVGEDEKAARRWLRAHGAALHAVGRG